MRRSVSTARRGTAKCFLLSSLYHRMGDEMLGGRKFIAVQTYLNSSSLALRVGGSVVERWRGKEGRNQLLGPFGTSGKIIDARLGCCEPVQNNMPSS